MTDNADRPVGSGQSDDLLEARPQPASRTAKVLARAEERKRRAEPADARTYAFARVVLRLLFGVCVGPEIVGRENVPRRGPLLVVGNHLSFLEPGLVPDGGDHVPVDRAGGEPVVSEAVQVSVRVLVDVDQLEPLERHRVGAHRPAPVEEVRVED